MHAKSNVHRIPLKYYFLWLFEGIETSLTGWSYFYLVTIFIYRIANKRLLLFLWKAW